MSLYKNDVSCSVIGSILSHQILPYLDKSPIIKTDFSCKKTTVFISMTHTVFLCEIRKLGYKISLLE